MREMIRLLLPITEECPLDHRQKVDSVEQAFFILALLSGHRKRLSKTLEEAICIRYDCEQRAGSQSCFELFQKNSYSYCLNCLHLTPSLPFAEWCQDCGAQSFFLFSRRSNALNLALAKVLSAIPHEPGIPKC